MPHDDIQILGATWRQELVRLVRTVKTSLVICSPFVGTEGTDLIAQNLPPDFRDGRANLLFLTNLSVRNMLQAVTDPGAILSLARSAVSDQVFHLPGLHAKAYIADESTAIVTSANLTAGGLYRNHECGVLLSTHSAVTRVRHEVTMLARLGAQIPIGHLTKFSSAVQAFASAYGHCRSSSESELLAQFKTEISPIEVELMRLRLSSGPIHTVFARTIEYLMQRHRAMTTVEIHECISSLHPDLCDDSVDRVIDGKRFGKKWKHAVRTAQQQLKKKGVVRYAGGKWQLAEKSKG